MDELFDTYTEYNDYSLLNHSYYYVIPFSTDHSSNYLSINLYISTQSLLSNMIYPIQNNEYSQDNITESYYKYETLFEIDAGNVFSYQFVFPNYYDTLSSNDVRLTYYCYSYGYNGFYSDGVFDHTPPWDMIYLLLKQNHKNYSATNESVFPSQPPTLYRSPPLFGTVPPVQVINTSPNVFGVPVNGGYNFYGGMITNDSAGLQLNVEDAEEGEINTGEYFNDYLKDYSAYEYFNIGKNSVAWARYYYKFYNPGEADGTVTNMALNTILSAFDMSGENYAQNAVSDILNKPYMEDNKLMDGVVMAYLEDYNTDDVSVDARDFFTKVWNLLMGNGLIALIIYISLSMLILAAVLQRS